MKRQGGILKHVLKRSRGRGGKGREGRDGRGEGEGGRGSGGGGGEGKDLPFLLVCQATKKRSDLELMLAL